MHFDRFTKYFFIFYIYLNTKLSLSLSNNYKKTTIKKLKKKKPTKGIFTFVFLPRAFNRFIILKKNPESII
jgi:hypothetical protein